MDTSVLYYTSNDQGAGPLSNYWTFTVDDPTDVVGCGCCSMCYGQSRCIAWSRQNNSCYLVYAFALFEDLSAECYAGGVTVYDDPDYTQLQAAMWGLGPCGALAGTLKE